MARKQDTTPVHRMRKLLGDYENEQSREIERLREMLSVESHSATSLRGVVAAHRAELVKATDLLERAWRDLPEGALANEIATYLKKGKP